MRIVVFGPPGGGKGTQVDRIKSDAEAVSISPGDLLRQAVAEGTSAGRRADAFMRRGALVPDDVVIDLMRDRITQPDACHGFILDGYPRTLAQLEATERLLPALHMEPDAWLLIDVPEAVIEQRILGRRICSACQATFHVRFNPSSQGDACDRCGAPLVRRPDDDPDKLRTRLEAYRRDTMPVIERLRAQGRLITVEAHGRGLDEVESLVRDALRLGANGQERCA